MKMPPFPLPGKEKHAACPRPVNPAIASEVANR